MDASAKLLAANDRHAPVTCGAMGLAWAGGSRCPSARAWWCLSTVPNAALTHAAAPLQYHCNHTLHLHLDAQSGASLYII